MPGEWEIDPDFNPPASGAATETRPGDLSTFAFESRPPAAESAARLEASKRAIVETLPATGASLAGIPASAAGPLVGMGAAAGGAVAGRLLQRPVARALGTEAPPVPGGRELVGLGALEAVSEGLGRGVARLGTAAIRPLIRPDLATVRRAAGATGVPLKLSDVAGGRGPAILESALQQTPTGGPVIGQARAEQARALSQAADDYLRSIGGEAAKSVSETGEAATRAIQRQVTRTKGIEDNLFQAATTLGATGAKPVLVPIQGLRDKAQTLMLELAEELPAMQDRRIRALAEQIIRFDLERGGQAMPWARAMTFRQGIGAMLDEPMLVTPRAQARLKALFGAVSDDMEAAATAAARPDVLRRFREATAFAENRRALFAEGPIARLLKMDPEDVVRQLDATGGPTQVHRLRTAMLGEAGRTPDAVDLEAWNLVRRHILEGVFAPAEHGGAAVAMRGVPEERVISGPALSRKLGRIGAETLDALLAPAERQALRNLEVVAEAISRGERIAAVGYTSATPQGLVTQSLLTGGPAAAGGLLGGRAGALVGAAIGALAVPGTLAKAITNPKVVRLLTSPEWAEAVQAGRDLSLVLARFGGVLAAEGLVRPTLEGPPRPAPR